MRSSARCLAAEFWLYPRPASASALIDTQARRDTIAMISAMIAMSTAAP